MAKRERDIFCLYIGDVHAGGTTAAAPAVEVKRPEMQQMLDAYTRVVARAKKAAKGVDFSLMLGGDLVDGSRHHGNHESWGTPDEQRDGAVALLLPLANMANSIYALLGTEAHAGPNSGEDLSVARQLGAKTAKKIWRYVVGGKRIFWTHHGLGIPRDVNGAERALFSEAKRHYDQHKESLADLHEYDTQPHDPDELRPALVEKPDFVIHHHAHFSPRPVTAFGMQVAVCPCWQLSTMYGVALAPERTPTIGALAVWPKQGRIERWRQPVEFVYEVVPTA